MNRRLRTLTFYGLALALAALCAPAHADVGFKVDKVLNANQNAMKWAVQVRRPSQA